MHFVQHRPHHDIGKIFAEEQQAPHGFLRVSAPMVRYSKLEFRKLLRQNGVKLCFTPMIIADSFNNSQKARENEFTTLVGDDEPLISQFAACDADEFLTASQLIYPYVDGVDLNCGCPQSWAIAKGYGCGVLKKPEVVKDIVMSVRRTLPQDFSVSVKIRLLNGCHKEQNGESEGIRATVEFARQLQQCGVNFLSLHGRTMWQRTSDPLNIPAMKTICESLQIPLIVNGNVRSWTDACELQKVTGAAGVMAARGLLSNPAIFNTELYNQDYFAHCAQQWLDIAARAGNNLHFQCFHHHLSFMGASHLKRKQRLEFNNFTQKTQVLNFLEEHFGLKTSPMALKQPFEYSKCTYSHFMQANQKSHNQPRNESKYNPNTAGKFFTEFMQTDEETTAVQKQRNNEDKTDFELASFFNEEV